MEKGIGKSIYADDGALWKRGQNITYTVKKVPQAVNKVEEWAKKWGFQIPVEKTRVICFKKKRNVHNKRFLYGKQLEQVSVVRFLGVWLDEKLNFNIGYM